MTYDAGAAAPGRAVPARCDECGFDFELDLVALAERCSTAADAVRVSLSSGSIGERPAAGVWAPIEYAAHLGDAIEWYVDRVHLVLAEDRPQLAPFDFDAVAGEYARRSRDEVVDAVGSACRRLADVAGSLGASQLGRSGVGSDGTARTVATLLARADHEIVHHLMDLRRGSQA